jgi:Zn-dependent protease
MAVNISLVLFNLIPAFPMDGGRVLRALLAMRLDYVRATQVAASIGQGIAFLFGLAGLFGNPFLLFIALFVWIGASQEASMVQMRNSISGIPVTNAMQTKLKLSPQLTVLTGW